MNTENGKSEFDDSHTEDTTKLVPLTAEQIEQAAHNAALELALSQDEIEEIAFQLEKSTSAHTFSEEGRAFLKELALQPEYFSHKYSYAEASELFYKIAGLCDEVIPFNRPGDIMRESHKDSIYRLNIEPRDLIDATVLACFSKQPDIMASFESWAILKPMKGNPFAFSKLFVPYEVIE